MSDQLLKRIAHLSPERREQLLRRLNAGLEPQQARQPALPLRQPGEPCLLSFAQQRLWFLDQLDEQSSEYTVCRAIHLTGGLDEKILERSLYMLVARHEILRTTFSVPEGAHEPVQVITSPPPSLLQIQDLTALPASQRLPQAQAIARAEALRPFDLAHGPLARFLLLRMETEEHLLVLCLHHILADGWSLALALRELSLLYTHLLSQPAAETSSPLPPLALQFADYAAWQRHTLQGEHLNELLSYWQHHLQGAPFELALPTDHPRPLQLSHQGRVLTHQPSAPFSHQLTLLARREDVTPFMLLLTVFSILLGRLSGQHDLLIGTPVANRNREEIEALIGCVANTLVVRVRLGECRSFQEVLRQVRESTLQAYAHQDLPFEKVVEALQPQRDLRRTPLFQVMFVFQNTPTSSLALPGIEARMEIIDVESAPFELTCSIEEREAGLEVGIQYNRELFDASTIQRWLRCYEALLNQCLENPDIPLSSLSLLPMGELQHFTNLWERTHPTRDLCLHTLFTEQASQRPDALAVISETTTLTYRELELRANRLAHQLIALGVKAETLVGIYIERSPEMLVGLLAILKAGGAYVPLDPAYPVERLRFMLEDAQPAVILTMEHLRSHLPLSGLATPCICLDTQSDAVSSLDAPPHIALSTQNIAYVIYTSGSTGIPKGVCITHEASVQFCQNIAEHYAFVPEEHVLQFASLSFDLALEEIFAPLSKGATLVLWPQQTTLDLIELTRFMDREQIAVANLSSSLWNAWLDMLIQQELQPPSSLRLMITGNEPIETGRLHLWQQHVGDRIRWLHAYGVTEATVTSTLYSPDLPGLEGAVPIGLPVYNTRIFVLDPHLQPVLPGMPGELYIGGTALARGYLHHPEITAERFVPDPFGSTPGSLLYRTGDLVCYREDGLLRYVGRSDQQVKIHGFRIEVAEVEQALKQHPSLKEVAVIAHGEPTGEKALVAYFVFQDRQTVPTQRLRDFLREHLPAFMLPATFVQLEAFPLLPNGKLDRQRLPELADGLVEEESNMFAPRTPLEDLVLGIWKDLLHLEHIPITANFFELGGYSLLAAQVTSRLRRALQRDVPVRLLFENPTIAHLAARLEQLLQEASVEMLSPILPVERDSSLPPSFEQLRLWFLDQLEPASALYNLPTCIHLTGGLEEEVLERSLHMLVSRHEILRTTFSVPEGAHEPVQVIVSPPPSLLQIQDLTALPASQRLLQAQAIARAEALRPFDLAHGPLARFLLLRLETDEHLLVLCLHHILADGWSLALALQELSLLYTHLLSQPAAEASSPLPPLALQFADYAAWQRHTLQGERLNELLSYWQHHLQDAPFELTLPTDHPRPLQLSHQGRVLTHQLSAPFSHQLTLLARREDVTLFMLLLTVFSILLGRLSGQHDLLIGTPVANRNREEIEALIGCVANTLVVRVRLGACRSFQDVLRQVRESTLQAYAHQDLPFEKVVEALQPQRDLRRTPLFQVMFVFQNTPAQSLEFPAVQCEFLTLPLDLAKFDLAFSVTETGQGFNITVEYSDELFNATTIQRLLESYQILLESVLLDAKMDWHQLPLLSTQEQNKLLKEWGQPPAPASYEISELPLHRLFEEQVRQTPQAIALMFRDQRLRFTELNQRANQLAAYLCKYTSAVEVPIGLCVERSPEMIIGLLAILKAGGYYVPLDPAYPQERLTFLMEDAQIAVLLTQSHLRATLPALAAMQIPTVCLDRDAETIALASPDNLICEVGADNLAYSIYTSGSTGRPKGVLVPHRGVSNVLRHALHTYVLQPGQQMMQHTSLSFDASVLEIFTSLLSGGCLHLLPPELAGSGEGLAQFINEEEITLLIITPSMLETVPYAEYPTLRTIVLGGESCPEELAHRWLQRYRLLNVYAPTETSIYMTQAELQGSSQSPFPLGRPIGYMSVYVLDQYMQPVPIGVCGELYIGGIGVTRGYHHLPAVTAERFVPDPFTSEPGKRLYKTGDLACYLSTGELRFLGRDDDQVKIRGLRVELGEIETVLARHPRVQQAIVLLEGQTAFDKQLIACFIPTEGPDPSQELRQFLGQSLPAALVPNRFVSFTSFPLNANGKIDRQGVQHMLSERRNIFEATTEYQAPRNPVEERLVAIWQQILGGPPIGVYDNFFQRGGHSLLATQIVSLVRTAFQVDLPLRALFEAPTVAELAERIIQSELSQADAAILARLLEQLQGEE